MQVFLRYEFHTLQRGTWSRAVGKAVSTLQTQQCNVREVQELGSIKQIIKIETKREEREEWEKDVILVASTSLSCADQAG